MDNMEYIKSLEERIEKLEEFISKIQADKLNNIKINDCQIESLVLASKKNINLNNINVQNFANASLITKIENGNIEKLEIKEGKQKFRECKLYK